MIISAKVRVTKVGPRQIAARFLSWYSVEQAANKAKELFAASGDKFYTEVEGSIRSEGRNRAARRKNKIRKA